MNLTRQISRTNGVYRIAPVCRRDRSNNGPCESGLPELEVLAALTPGTCHSPSTLAAVSGLSLRTIRAIERQALAKMRRSPELRELLREARSGQAA